MYVCALKRLFCSFAKNRKMHRIAIFASGTGTNATRFFEYFKNHEKAEISLLLSNNPNAKVLQSAALAGVPTFVFSAGELKNTSKVQEKLREQNIDFIVLAGFMLLIPEDITLDYQNRIVNIHPALLPDFGGKGMYGHHVHKAVIESGRKKSGISIHYVNSIYDDGDIIFRAECKVLDGDTVESLSARIQKLEHEHYPKIVEKLIKELP